MDYLLTKLSTTGDKPVNKLPGTKIYPIGELFIREKRNHQGRIDSVIRWFKMTARQAYQKFGDRIPAMLLAAMEQKSENMYDFLHCVQPRMDYEEGEWGPKGMPYSSQYISYPGSGAPG